MICKILKIIKLNFICLIYDSWNLMNIEKNEPNQQIQILDIVCRSDRFDIIFKIIFVKMLLNFGTSFNWARALYANSIKVLNGVYEMTTIFQKKEKHTQIFMVH